MLVTLENQLYCNEIKFDFKAYATADLSTFNITNQQCSYASKLSTS